MQSPHTKVLKKLSLSVSNLTANADLYTAEFHARLKQLSEDWATFAEELKRLVDKAFPDLDDAARERLAVDRFLTQLDDPQLAFSVRQAKPKTLDKALTSTLEMQSHLQLSTRVLCAAATQPQTETTVAGITPSQRNDRLTDVLKQLVERIEKLETNLAANRSQDRQDRTGRPAYNAYYRHPCQQQCRLTPSGCYCCGQVGHFARDSPAPSPIP